MATTGWSAREDDRLVDLLYDAALDGALWPDALALLGDRVRAHPGNLTQINFRDGSGFGLAARAPDDIMARYFADWAQRNPIALAENPADYSTGWAPRITRDSQSVDRRRLERSDFWNEFLAPIGAHHLIILRLSLRGDDVTTVTLGRPHHHGAFADDEIGRLGGFHRHLIRAERIWRGLGLRQAELDRFDALLADASRALFFLDDRLQVTRWTAAAEAPLRLGGALRVTGGRLEATRSSADGALRRLLTAALAGGTPAPVALPALRHGEAVMVSAARLGERALAGTRGVMVSVRPLTPADPAVPLRTTFGLTPAEAELALALAAGDSLRAIATRRGVSINTVRNQLGAVFDKTGCHRQQDLIRMLASRPH